jgi:hypothetical protein
MRKLQASYALCLFSAVTPGNETDIRTMVCAYYSESCGWCMQRLVLTQWKQTDPL